ncbi:DUF6707 family protein [Catellatospora coxensis]|uniref:Uncharacterized protein n=1 Tax=Catellatospora coxensis TaxID=310354 RepID=A0A8J3PBA8_9ACTN|nr:DUF6707 family protein [Catellatospora coxensis]GIG11116.1 hypothetical protein Cco03nite_78160 [Catellatospora coxensis]
MSSLSELAEQARQALAVALAPEEERQRDLKRMKTMALKRLSFTRLEALQRLDELTARLHLHRREDELSAVGRELLAYRFDGNFTRYGPVENVLALTVRTAMARGDLALAEACRSHIVAAYGRPDEWDARGRWDAMENRLGGWQVEWQEGNRPADDLGYTSAQLGELAFLGLWGGHGRWPLERIDREFDAKTAYLRALLKL